MVRQIACILAVLAAAVAGCSSQSDAPTPASSSRAPAAAASANNTSPASSTPISTEGEVHEGGASTPEASFLEGLPAAGVPVREAESVTGTGQRICKALGSGKSVDEAARIGTEEQPWTPDQAKAAVTAAAELLCPENSDKVGN